MLAPLLSLRAEQSFLRTEGIVAAIRKAVQGRFTSIEDAFAEFNTEKAAALEPDQLKAGLIKVGGPKLESRDLSAVVRRADANGDG